MMHVAIDPTERRKAVPARPARAEARAMSRGRAVTLGALGCIALAGLSAAAYSALGSVAGPQVVRPNIYQIQKGQGPAQAKASDWPDMRDGVPVLAEVSTKKAEPVPASAEAAFPMPAPLAQPAIAEKPVTLASVTPATPVAPPAKPMPVIQAAGIVSAPHPAAVVGPTRTAAVIAPSSAQTTRARAAETTFASLPAEPAAPPKKPAAAVKPAVAKAKPAKPVVEANAQAAAAPVAEPEPEHSEVFGLKVPSFAPAGRKIVEGVEALGNAVKNLPNQF